MPKFIIKETQACWVTWEYEIEAENADAAEMQYLEEHPSSDLPPEIGDSIDGYNEIIKVEPAE